MYQQLFHKSKFLHRMSIVIRIDSIALLLKCNPFEQSRHGFIPIPFLRSQTSSWDTTTERKAEKKNQTISVINQISSTNRPFLFSWHIPPHKLARTHRRTHAWNKSSLLLLTLLPDASDKILDPICWLCLVC